MDQIVEIQHELLAISKQIAATQHFLVVMSLIILALQIANLFMAIRVRQITKKLNESQLRINELTDQRLTMLEQPCR